MKLLEEALVLSQLEHQLMELRSCHKILHENVETQICVNGAMSSQLRDMNKVSLLFTQTLSVYFQIIGFTILMDLI